MEVRINVVHLRKKGFCPSCQKQGMFLVRYILRNDLTPDKDKGTACVRCVSLLQKRMVDEPQKYCVEWNGDCWQSVFPEQYAHHSQLHTTIEDALNYMVNEVGVARDQIEVIDNGSTLR